jgi:hypothetical protein
MLRDMGGRKTFIIRMGSPARIETLVDIFAYAEPAVVGTVEQQRAYWRKWFDSLKERK